MTAAADGDRLSPARKEGFDLALRALEAVATEELLSEAKASALKQLELGIQSATNEAKSVLRRIGDIPSRQQDLDDRAAQTVMLTRQLMDVFMGHELRQLSSRDDKYSVTISRSSDTAVQAIRATSYIVWGYLQGTPPPDAKAAPSPDEISGGAK
jgi:hypothetical protein